MLWKSLSDKVPLEYQPKGSDRVTHVDISPSSEIGAVGGRRKVVQYGPCRKFSKSARFGSTYTRKFSKSEVLK